MYRKKRYETSYFYIYIQIYVYRQNVCVNY